ELGVLDEQGSRVDANAGRAPVEPEAQDVFVLLPDVRMRPVQVRLLGSEQVQVPLAAVVRAGPRRPAEDRLPGVRRRVAVRPRAGPEPEARALGRPGCGRERRPEPRVLIGYVVR